MSSSAPDDKCRSSFPVGFRGPRELNARPSNVPAHCRTSVRSERSLSCMPTVPVVQRQVWRGGSREGSGRDAIVLLMLQRDCMVSMLAIQASQPSSPRALVHSQQVALVRARDTAAELELSCGPSTTQLEAAEDQARWAPAMQQGRRCRRRGRSRRPHHRPRCAACHWSTWSAGQCGQWACAGGFKVHLGST